MCEPTTMMAMSAAQAGLQLAGQAKAAKQQAASQQAATERENLRFRQEMSARRAKEAFDAKIAVGEVQEIVNKTRKAKATARTAAGEAGVTGVAVDQLLTSFEQQEAQALFAIQEQQAMGRVNSLFQDRDAELASLNRLDQINQPIEGPDYLGTAVNLAGNVMKIQSFATQQALGASRLELDKQQTLLNKQQLELNKRQLS